VFEQLLDLTDLLESLAEECQNLPGNDREKWVARRLLVDAAAHTRGAARQIDIRNERLEKHNGC